MTQPAWDGRGRDPWLPARLDARINVGEAERAIRRSFWSALSGWLVETSRRVLRGQRPDIDAIAARGPAWAEAVDQVLSGAIAPAMRGAYETLLGEGFRFEQRASAASYLAEVRNRMVAIPDDVFDLVAGEVVRGVNLGEGAARIADRVDDVLSTTGSDRWPNRATTVARTESIGALNFSRNDSFHALAEETGDEFEKVWLSTIDNRTRDTHRAADGQRVPVGESFIVGGFELEFPGDPDGPAEEIINCRCTMLLVEPGENTDLSNRQFLGG